jgi:hypothetical protein
MGTRTNAERYARPIAEIIGIAADDTVVRYGVMSLSFVFLLAAAYLFGPTEQLGAMAVLSLIIAIILFIIYWWFLEEARKRRVMLAEEQPHENDSSNPDLRDEVAFACVVLLIVTAFLLQTLNGSSLHYKVDADILHLKSLVCGTYTKAFCTANARLFELPAWIFYTLQSFVTTIPMADQIGDYAAKMTGVTPTTDTPAYVPSAVRFIFGGLLFTIVIGSFQKVGRQIDSAVEALAHTHTLAAGMGPIVIARLHQVLSDASQEARWQNALLALADIAGRYQGTHGEINKQFGDLLAAKFDAIGPKDNTKLQRLTALATVFCAIESERGLNMVVERIRRAGDYVNTKIKLVKTVVDKLDHPIAIQFLQTLEPASLSKSLFKCISGALSELDAADSLEGDGDDEPDPIVPPSAHHRRRVPDVLQQTLPLSGGRAEATH